MKLFIQLYMDEDVSIVLSKLLKARGFDVITSRDANMLGKTDEEQLTYAATCKRVLFTHNRVDFENLYTEYLKIGKFHWGIIIANRRDEYSLLNRLLMILNNITMEEMRNQIRYI